MAAPPSSHTPKRSSDAWIGNYRRQEQIGKGSFAVVYKAVHPDDGSLVAIKAVQHHRLKGKLRDNLFSEIDILKGIQHPHVVALIGILESPNHIHLIMEYCQLGDMATFVKKREKLDTHPVTAEMMRHYPNPKGGFGFNEVVVRHFAKQLASALEFLRSKNLVHRDLKPQNLLLNPPSSYLANEKPENRPHEVAKNSLIPAAGVESFPFMKIADFGFARHLPQTTMAETLCGSPLYMAPEILRYEKYDAKADLWSVGTVLYELMVGKPPFKAANHVELLRKIEKTMDKIKFPEDLAISDEMQRVTRGLLRKMPTERMSWDNFFQSALIKEDIPGLIKNEPKKSAPPEPSPVRSKQSAPTAKPEEKFRPLSNDERPNIDRTISGPPLSPATTARRLSTTRDRRPALNSHATDTNVPGIKLDRIPQSSFDKRRSQDTPSPSTSAPRSDPEKERSTQRNKEKALRERAAQDVAFERDYVMIEKRQVEFNAFADELAASPKITGAQRNSPSSRPGAVARRATTQGAPISSLGVGIQSSPTKNAQMATRPETLNQRKPSYDSRFSPGNISATSALAAALNMVNFRLYGGPSSQGRTTPQGYGPFPTFPVTNTGPLHVGDNTRPIPLDEDQKVVNTVEECATRSDVVYGFAEVKYKQLAPLAPSSDNRLGIHRTVAENTEGDGKDEEVLTMDAICDISEEALVLYVKALAILENTLRLAGNWWTHKNRSEAAATIESSTSPRSMGDTTSGHSNGKAHASFAAAGVRINNVVQWARNRFNECLEKSEYVERRLLEAQRKLPSHHSSNPSSTTKSPPNPDMAGHEVSQQIQLSSGVTAEKLMYDRALDMSRSAAVNELVGEDLAGCEVSYATAIRLLEAVLETTTDDVSTLSKDATTHERNKSTKEQPEKDTTKTNRKDNEEAVQGIEDGDRSTVLKVIQSTKQRLGTLRKKMEARKQYRNNASSSRPRSNSSKATAVHPSTSSAPEDSHHANTTLPRTTSSPVHPTRAQPSPSTR